MQWLEQKAKQKQVEVFSKEEILFRQGEKVRGLFWIEEGLVKVTQKNGAKLQFARFAFSHDTIGHRSIFIEKDYRGTAEAISDYVRAYFFPTKEILEYFSQEPSFAKALLVKISQELHRAEEEQFFYKDSSVRQRLARFLLDMAAKCSERHEKGLLFRYDMKKTDLADILGVADETLIRTMSELKDQNLLAYEGKKILLLNPSALQKI